MLADHLLSSVFFVVGPTASGKSTLAAEIAALAGGQVVGADAFQVYEGLDILTAKPPKSVMDRVPHHLIGEIPLEATFDVSQYLQRACAKIAALAASNIPAVVVGGTGLYIQALTHGLADLPTGDPAIRAELELQPLEELQRRLQALDPEGAKQIDLKNPRRVLRALEVCILTGRPFSESQTQWNAPARPLHGVFLCPARDTLRQHILQRAVDMFEQGVIDEVKNASPAGLTASKAIGYQAIRSLLAGTCSRADCVQQIQDATLKYAKRQVTWFRKKPGFPAQDPGQISARELLARWRAASPK